MPSQSPAVWHATNWASFTILPSPPPVVRHVTNCTCKSSGLATADCSGRHLWLEWCYMQYMYFTMYSMVSCKVSVLYVNMNHFWAVIGKANHRILPPFSHKWFLSCPLDCKQQYYVYTDCASHKFLSTLFLMILSPFWSKLEVNYMHINLLVRAKATVMNKPWLLSNPLCVSIIKARSLIDINTTSNWTTCFWYLVITHLAWL